MCSIGCGLKKEQEIEKKKYRQLAAEIILVEKRKVHSQSIFLCLQLVHAIDYDTVILFVLILTDYKDLFPCIQFSYSRH